MVWKNLSNGITMEIKNKSKILYKCQACNSVNLKSIFFFGFVPSVNSLTKIKEKKHESAFFPLDFYICKNCSLGQISCVVDKEILFPKSYPYTSSTTKVLRENFKNLSQEVKKFVDIKKNDLIVDIGSNDGNLLSFFKRNMRVLGITPEEIGKLAIKRGIPTILDYFNNKSRKKIINKYGKAKIITATNVFAHIDNLNNLISNIKKCLDKDGVFISESHYLLKVISGVQYDTIYHEHMRYYSLTSLQKLFKKNNLHIFHAKEIPTHGGSIRVYVSNNRNIKETLEVKKILKKEKKLFSTSSLEKFKKDVFKSKLDLISKINHIKKQGHKIYGIGAPSRASTLICYTGLDENMVSAILEVKGSSKIGKYMPGTKIPVINENEIKYHNLKYLLLFSWHIKHDLKKIFRKKGFKGKFITPLPKCKIEN